MVFDVVTVGNALVDALLTLKDAKKHIHLNAQTHDLSIRSGEKFLVENCTFAIGGGASRVAIGLSRLGYKTSIFAETGTGPLSEMVVSYLKNAHVDTGHILTSDNKSSFTVGLNFKGERTLFTHHVPYDHAFSFDSLKTQWLYLASLGKEWKGVYKKVEEYITKTNTHLAFNPGASQFEEGRKTFLHLLPVTDVLFVNKQEAVDISESGENVSVETLLQKLHAMGPRTVVITDGKNGAYCASQSGALFHITIMPSEVVEKTGAGDAFAAGFLAGVLANQPIQTALTWGTINSASTIGKIGGETGLLTKDTLLKMAKRDDVPQAKAL